MLLALVGTAAALFAIQVIVGALQIWMKLEWWVVSLHLAIGSAIWGLLWGAALYGWYRARAAALEGAPDGGRRTVAARPTSTAARPRRRVAAT